MAKLTDAYFVENEGMGLILTEGYGFVRKFWTKLQPVMLGLGVAIAKTVDSGGS